LKRCFIEKIAQSLVKSAIQSSVDKLDELVRAYSFGFDVDFERCYLKKMMILNFATPFVKMAFNFPNPIDFIQLLQ
jgi:hypothetical protein